VVVVIGNLTINTNDIPDEMLLPFDKAMDRGLNYYVAIVNTVANASHTLGNGMITSIDSVKYTDQPLRSNQKYRAFVRVYSAHVC